VRPHILHNSYTYIYVFIYIVTHLIGHIIHTRIHPTKVLGDFRPRKNIMAHIDIDKRRNRVAAWCINSVHNIKTKITRQTCTTVSTIELTAIVIGSKILVAQS